MSTIDKFTLAQSDSVTFPSSHKQSAENIFNFDTKNVDKFTHKEKSIPLSDIETANPMKAIISNGTETNNIHSIAVQNIIFNKLYDESQTLCNVPFDDGSQNDIRSENDAQRNYNANNKHNMQYFECGGK